MSLVLLLALGAVATGPSSSTLFPVLSGTALAADDALDSVPRMEMEQFKKLWGEHKVVVIDVRDTRSYGAGHIPGAVSIPIAALVSHVPGLRKSPYPIVTYCT